MVSKWIENYEDGKYNTEELVVSALFAVAATVIGVMGYYSSI